MWRHSFVFLQKNVSVIVPNARCRAQLLACGYGEKKLEFEHDGRAAHVHDVICGSSHWSSALYRELNYMQLTVTFSHAGKDLGTALFITTINGM